MSMWASQVSILSNVLSGFWNLEPSGYCLVIDGARYETVHTTKIRYDKLRNSSPSKFDGYIPAVPWFIGIEH